MPFSLSVVPRFSTPFFPRLLAALLSLSIAALQAAEPSALGQEGLRQQQQQQRDLQQLQLEQRRRQLQRGSFGPAPSTPALPAQVTADERCWPLSGTRIGGVTLLNRHELNEQLKPQIASCMGVGQINHLLATITDRKSVV